MKAITGLPLFCNARSLQRVIYCIVIAVVSLFCTPGTANGQGQPIAVSVANPELTVTAAEYLPDPKGTLSIEGILDSTSTTSFKPYHAEEPGYTDTVKNYWLRFTVQNDDDVDREWIFNFDGWSHVVLFTPGSDGVIKTQETGHLQPISKRDYPVANKNNVLVLLRRNITQTYYVLLESRPDHVIRPTDLRFNIALRTVQDKKESRHRHYIGIFMGIYAVMFLYNFFIYTSTRDKAYIYFLMHIIGLTYMTLNNSGHSVSTLGPLFDNFPLWRGSVESLGSAYDTVVAILFTMTFLNTKEYLPFWHKVFRVFMGVIVILAIGANVKFDLFAPFIYLFMILILVAFVTVGIKGVLKKVPSARYYLLAYIFSIAGTLVLALTLLGAIPVTEFTYSYSSPTGYALQMLFFSFALANKINILKKSNEENQKQIIAHLKENEQLQLRVTHELEEKVAERTSEVVKQKELIEAEKEKSERLLYNILPETVAKELIETGSTKSARYDEVSILFTDFVDFTNISASIPPSKLVQELNDIFYLFDDIVKDTGLEKIKTIGDSYMAVSGLPIERDDHAVLCVRAAVAMLKCIKERNEHSAIKWNIRAGIHSGPVVAGVVGKHKFTFDLWGDAVNMASRMESNGVPGSVNMSAYTYDLVRNDIRCTYRGKITIKGKGDIDMYYVDLAAE